MKTITTLGGVSVLGLLGACQSGPVRMPATPAVRITGLEAASHRDLGVDIDNRAGSVKVEVDRGLKAPQVSATVTSLSGQRTAAPWVAADLDASGPWPVLRVLAAPPVGHEEAFTDLVVRLPSCGGVRVRNRRGPVSLQGVAGAIDVQNGSEVEPGGAVTAILGRPADDPILLQSGDGPIALDLPRGSMGRVAAEARTGMVLIIGDTARLSEVASRHGSWSGVINAGENAVKLETGRGDITIRLMP